MFDKIEHRSNNSIGMRAHNLNIKSKIATMTHLDNIQSERLEKIAQG